MQPIIIGISGKKRTGKDTVANRLVDKYGFTRLSFADPLKDSAKIIFHFTDDQLYGDKKEVLDPRWNKTPREIMQLLGTEAIRGTIDNDVWIKSLQIKNNNLIKSNPTRQLKLAIPDVRFPNEAEAIKNMTGGFLWRVYRDIPLNESSTHPSETALDDYQNWNSILNNTSTMSNLYKSVDLTLDQIVNAQENTYAYNRRRSETD